MVYPTQIVNSFLFDFVKRIHQLVKIMLYSHRYSAEILSTENHLF